MKTSPWTRIEVSWWPEIAEHLCGEWPEEAACMDLRWYADQVRHGRLKRIPGRPALRRRWGWSDRRVRSLLSTPERWADPVACPADVQPVSSERPEISATSQVEPSAVSSERPARVQQMSTRAELHNSQFTPHTTTASEEPPTPPVDAAVDSVEKSSPPPKQSRRPRLINPEVGRYLRSQGYTSLRQVAELTRDGMAAVLPTNLRSRANLDSIEAALVRDGLSWASDRPRLSSISNSQPQPWMERYTSSPAPLWSPEDARQWADQHRRDLNRLQAAGAGPAELQTWLTPRVTDPAAVLAVLEAAA
jgi:hypothetical protein